MKNPKKVDNLAKAREAWGNPAPDWIEVLAEAANATTQSAVGERIGTGGSTISQLLSNTYPGDVAKFETIIRGRLMAETVDCPILQAIGRDVCLGWQKRPFSTASGNAVRMHQACRSGCPHSRLTPMEER